MAGKVILIIHNVRSAHNVGSMLRSAEAMGVSQVYLSGYSPYPASKNDPRLPHEQQQVNKKISKTALGAELLVSWHFTDDTLGLIDKLKKRKYVVTALEITKNSIELPVYKTSNDIALIVGNEVGGIDEEVLTVADIYLKIPMLGRKKSLNVAVAAAIALYHLRFKT